MKRDPSDIYADFRNGIQAGKISVEVLARMMVQFFDQETVNAFAQALERDGTGFHWGDADEGEAPYQLDEGT